MTATAQGVKPVGGHQHDYTYRWLWGAFSFLTGRNYSMYTCSTDKLFFINHLETISEDNPKRLNLVVIDNAGFHSLKDILKLASNIFLIRLPAYSPELNPDERVWRYLKDKIAMKIFESAKHLEDTLENIVKNIDNKIIKSLISYDLYKKYFHVFSNV